MPDTVRTGLRLKAGLNTKLILIAEQMGISKNALMVKALWDLVEARERKEPAEGRGGDFKEGDTK